MKLRGLLFLSPLFFLLISCQPIIKLLEANKSHSVEFHQADFRSAEYFEDLKDELFGNPMDHFQLIKKQFPGVKKNHLDHLTLTKSIGAKKVVFKLEAKKGAGPIYDQFDDVFTFFKKNVLQIVNLVKKNADTIRAIKSTYAIILDSRNIPIKEKVVQLKEVLAYQMLKIQRYGPLKDNYYQYLECASAAEGPCTSFVLHYNLKYLKALELKESVKVNLTSQGLEFSKIQLRREDQALLNFVPSTPTP